jgi:hypothetical protein
MDPDIFHRMVQETPTTIDIASMVSITPYTDIVLPLNKIWGLNTMPIWQLKAVILTISRDAFNLGMAMTRLEADTNYHARHMIIDRMGKIYLAAGLTTSLRHMHGVRNDTLTHENTISIELVNCGAIPEKRLQHKRMIMRDTSDVFHHRLSRSSIVIAEDGNYYEAFYYEQLTTLKKLLTQLRNLQPDLQIMNSDRWANMSYYKLTLAFPSRRFRIKR